MSWEKVHNTVSFMISEIKAQIDEKDIGQEENDNKIVFHFLPGTDIQKLKEIEIDQSTEDRIVTKVMEELNGKRSLIIALEAKDLLQLIGDTTAAAMSAIAEADDKKTGNP